MVFVWGLSIPSPRLLCRANCLTKSRAGLHHGGKSATVYALHRIKLSWTGRDWSMSYPLDNPKQRPPRPLFANLVLRNVYITLRPLIILLKTLAPYFVSVTLLPSVILNLPLFNGAADFGPNHLSKILLASPVFSISRSVLLTKSAKFLSPFRMPKP